VLVNKYFDLIAQRMSFETDVKFYIRTPFDFFILSFIWEQELQGVFRFEEGMNFLDIGAHIGKYTIRAGMKIGKEGKVVAIEPDKDNFDLLVRNIEANGLQNCVALNLAAYRADTEVNLFLASTSREHSIMEDFGKGSRKVTARALDSVLEEIGIEKVDLIKIDVEGAELEVLEGLENTLTKQNPLLIVEILKRDEDKVIRYLGSLYYKKELLHVLPDYKGGLMFYCFKKQHHPTPIYHRYV
jgi:FkbM family methyltransferase